MSQPSEDTEFALVVNVRVQQLDHGAYRGQGIEVNHQINLPAMGFLELAKVLGQFHDLAEQIKAERGHP